jgi:hypothetical protein
VNPAWLGFGLSLPGLSAATPIANALRLAEELATELGERRSVSGYGMTRRLFGTGSAWLSAMPLIIKLKNERPGIFESSKFPPMKALFPRFLMPPRGPVWW